MKKLISLITFLAFSVAASAQGLWKSGVLTNGPNLVVPNAGSVAYLQVIDTSGSANSVILYDNSSATLTNIATAAYSSVTYYPTNVVITFTNQVGVVNSYTNSILASVTVANPTNFPEANRLWMFTIPANGSATFQPLGTTGFNYGLQIKLTGAGAYNLNYRNLPY